jgi:hypothetical protein
LPIGGLQVIEGTWSVQPDALLWLDRARGRDVDPVGAAAAQVPFPQCREEAEPPGGAARQRGGEEDTVEREVRPAHRDDLRVLAMETPDVGAIVDLVRGQIERSQLVVLDDAVAGSAKDLDIQRWAP